MAALAVDDRYLFYAVFNGMQGIFNLRDHAAADAAVRDHTADGGRIDGRDQPAGGIHHAVDVGQQDQPAGGEGRGDVAGHQVRIDVVGFPVLTGAHRGDDGNEPLFGKGMDDVGVDPCHLPHHTRIDDLRRTVRIGPMNDTHLRGFDEATVLAAEPHGLAPLPVDPGHDFLVNLAAQHHLHHIHGGSVGKPHTTYKLGADAHLIQYSVNLGPPAVHHHRVEADKLEQGDIPGKIGFQVFVHHGVAAILHHHSHAGKLADIG